MHVLYKFQQFINICKTTAHTYNSMGLKNHYPHFYRII